MLVQLAGWRTQIRPVRGQIAMLTTQPPLLRRVLLAGDHYLVPRPDGRVLVGSTEEDVGFDKRTTAEAIQSGLVIGYSCLIEGMLDLFRKELGADAKSVLTGGLAEVMAPNVSGIDEVDPWLVLTGLRIIYERNLPHS